MFTLSDFERYKQKNKKISVVTAYDYFAAQLLEEAGVEVMLVGDSVGMVFAGNENTLSVTLEDMIYHARAVKRGAPRSFVVVDMPYLSYHVSPTETVKNAGKLMKEVNIHAVKVEINHEATLAHVEALLQAQIPVIGHVGLTPQSVNLFGGFKRQGKTEKETQKIINFAVQLDKLGVSAVVLECIPADLAKKITDMLSVPTIGIGAGCSCDGQVLVFYDMLGFTSSPPKFVKPYANAHDYFVSALKNYIQEVHNQVFPDASHSF